MQEYTSNDSILKVEEPKIISVVKDDDDSSCTTITFEDHKGKSNVDDDDDDAENYFETIIGECKPNKEEKPDFWKRVSNHFEPSKEEVVGKKEEDDKVGLFFKGLSERFNANKEQQNNETLNKSEPSNIKKESNRQKAEKQQQRAKPNDLWKNLAKAINDPNKQKQGHSTKEDGKKSDQTNHTVSEENNVITNNDDNIVSYSKKVIEEQQREKKDFWKVLAKAIIEPDKPPKQEKGINDDHKKHSDQQATNNKSILEKEAHEKEIKPNNNAEKERPKNLWSLLAKSISEPQKLDQSNKNEDDDQVRNKLDEATASKQVEPGNLMTEETFNDRNQELESVITKGTKISAEVLNIFEELDMEPLTKETTSNDDDTSTAENNNETMLTSATDLSQQIDNKKKENEEILNQINSIVSNAKNTISQEKTYSSDNGSEQQQRHSKSTNDNANEEQHEYDLSLEQSGNNLFGSGVFDNQDLPPSFSDDTDDENLNIAMYDESSSTKIESIIESNNSEHDKLIDNSINKYDNEESNFKLFGSNMITDQDLPASFHDDASGNDSDIVVDNDQNDSNSKIESMIESIIESSNGLEQDQLTQSKDSNEELDVNLFDSNVIIDQDLHPSFYDSGEDSNDNQNESNTNIKSETIHGEDGISSTPSLVSEIASSSAKLEMIDLTDNACDEDKLKSIVQKDDLTEKALEEKDSSLSKNESKKKRSSDTTVSSEPKNVSFSTASSARHAPPRFTPCMFCKMIKKFYWFQSAPQYS